MVRERIRPADNSLLVALMHGLDSRGELNRTSVKKWVDGDALVDTKKWGNGCWVGRDGAGSAVR